MEDATQRLTKCFQIVFPGLAESQVPTASQASLESWDSVAAVTLASVVEEEFSIPVDFARLDELNSFDRVRQWVMGTSMEPVRSRKTGSLEQRVAETRILCEQALLEPEILTAGEILDRGGGGNNWLQSIIAAGTPPKELLALRLETVAAGLPAERRALERALLVRAAPGLLDRVAALPVEESVRHLVCKEIAFMASAEFEKNLPQFDMTAYPFLAACKILAGKRFPAGQMQWEISGFSRRWLAKVGVRALPETLAFFLTQAQGFYPYFEAHMSPTIHRSPILTEKEFYKSFYRMARSLECQPSIRAIMDVSWLHSSETYRVSPHLAFMNRPFEQAGGIVADIGPASIHDGFLENNPSRARLYESGQYKPGIGVALCGRDQALRWASQHPEIAEMAATVD